MAILKASEVRSMDRQQRRQRLQELREELMNERGVAAMGGSPPSPGKIRQLRTAIARIHTVNQLEGRGRLQFTSKEKATGAEAEHSRRTQAEAAREAADRKPAAAKPAAKKSPSKPKSPAKKTAGGAKPKKAAAKSTTQKAKKAPTGGKSGGHE